MRALGWQVPADLVPPDASAAVVDESFWVSWAASFPEQMA
jgi:hypothetical protein